MVEIIDTNDQQGKVAFLSWHIGECRRVADLLDVGKTDDEAIDGAMARAELVEILSAALDCLPDIYGDG
jgi:hypothetical protein